MLSPEEKLILSLCRIGFTKDQKSEIDQLIGKIKDWDNFVKLANEQGVVALCSHNIILTGNSDKVPEHILDLLNKSYLKSLAYNTRLYSLKDEIDNISKRDNIKVAYLKGIRLERLIYGDIGLRQISDLDILANREDALLLRELFIRNGFASQPMISPLHKKILPFLKNHLPQLIKYGIPVEIHTWIFDQKENNLTNDFLTSDINYSAGDDNLPETYWQVLFIYLVNHLENHENKGEFQLKYYIDLYLLLNGYRENILNENLAKVATQCDVFKSLQEKLHILNFYWNIDLKAWDLKYFESIDPIQYQEDFERLLKNPHYKKGKVKAVIIFKALDDIPGILNKSLYIIGYLIPGISYIKSKYNLSDSDHAFPYYFIRWFEIIRYILSGKTMYS